MASSNPPRRFRPEPVETTTKSSRKFAPEPIETTTKTSRKLAPEPVETTTKSSRKFAPEPVETITPSSRGRLNAGTVGNTRGKFSPQPVETTTKSSRKDNREEGKSGTSGDTTELEKAQPQELSKPVRRKFSPQLIETAKRSRKLGDTSPALLPSDHIEAMSSDQDAVGFASSSVPASAEVPCANDDGHELEVLEARRTGSSLAMRRSSISSHRQHSFRVPDLEPVESSESEQSIPPSPASSHSSTTDLSYYMYSHATRMRESVDDRFSGYMYQLAAKAAAKQMREQALAAFPNDDQHQPVDHYIGRDSDDRDVSSRTGSLHRRNEDGTRFSTVNWEMREMREHHKRLEEEQKERVRQYRDAKFLYGREPTPLGPWGDTTASMFAGNDASGAPKNIVGGWQRDIGIDQMRSSARPPMLGGDIEFPRCPSPEPARFDVTQGSHAIRNQMCYLTEMTKSSEAEGGLWANRKTDNNTSSLRSTASSRPQSRGGLWGGFCVGTGLTPPRGPTGLVTPGPGTPRAEMDNPFANIILSPPHQLPPSPPPSNSGMASLDEKLELEQAIEEEFTDEFVTQVYNYLSLGYPSLARKFDDELGKISRVPTTELRQDDHLATSRGYIRLGEDAVAGEEGISPEKCARWKALRVYIKEWARQQPRMTEAATRQGGWGVVVRRGSWAW